MSFGGIFGDAIFGDVVFGDLNGLSPARRRGRGVGGSGFPDNWFDIIAENASVNDRERRRIRRELEEVALLEAAGLL